MVYVCRSSRRLLNSENLWGGILCSTLPSRFQGSCLVVANRDGLRPLRLYESVAMSNEITGVVRVEPHEFLP